MLYSEGEPFEGYPYPDNAWDLDNFLYACVFIFFLSSWELFVVVYCSSLMNRKKKKNRFHFLVRIENTATTYTGVV